MKLTDLINPTGCVKNTMSDIGIHTVCDSSRLPSPLSNPQSLPSPRMLLSDIANAKMTSESHVHKFIQPMHTISGSTTNLAAPVSSFFPETNREFKLPSLVIASRSASASSPLHNHHYHQLHAVKDSLSASLAQSYGTYPSKSNAVVQRPSTGQGHNQHTISALHSSKRFPCTEPGCEKSFTRLYNLSFHLRSHRNEKPFPCTQCDFRFTRKHDLMRHVRSLHEARSFGPCPTCGNFFTRSDAFARHLKAEEERKVYFKEVEFKKQGMFHVS